MATFPRRACPRRRLKRSVEAPSSWELLSRRGGFSPPGRGAGWDWAAGGALPIFYAAGPTGCATAGTFVLGSLAKVPPPRCRRDSARRLQRAFRRGMWHCGRRRAGRTQGAGLEIRPLLLPPLGSPPARAAARVGTPAWRTLGRARARLLCPLGGGSALAARSQGGGNGSETVWRRSHGDAGAADQMARHVPWTTRSRGYGVVPG